MFEEASKFFQRMSEKSKNIKQAMTEKETKEKELQSAETALGKPDDEKDKALVVLDNIQDLSRGDLNNSLKKIQELLKLFQPDYYKLDFTYILSDNEEFANDTDVIKEDGVFEDDTEKDDVFESDMEGNNEDCTDNITATKENVIESGNENIRIKEIATENDKEPRVTTGDIPSDQQANLGTINIDDSNQTTKVRVSPADRAIKQFDLMLCQTGSNQNNYTDNIFTSVLAAHYR